MALPLGYPAIAKRLGLNLDEAGQADKLYHTTRQLFHVSIAIIGHRAQVIRPLKAHTVKVSPRGLVRGRFGRRTHDSFLVTRCLITRIMPYISHEHDEDGAISRSGQSVRVPGRAESRTTRRTL